MKDQMIGFVLPPPGEEEKMKEEAKAEKEQQRVRPEPGKTVVKEIKIKVCGECGAAITDSGLCDYECPYDGDERPAGKTLIAVWKQTNEFIRDEKE